MRASRLIVATFLIPVAALFAYYVALLWDRDSGVIDSNGSAMGVLVILGSVLGVSRVAQDESWAGRAAMSIALACAYFMLTWSVYGDSVMSPDASPHLVWFGLCVAAFMPAVVIVPASSWAWESYRRRSFEGTEAL
ncbi:MAG: hypothetical protein R8J94_11535 [Acidimicrobiia bacterium]|nr:hypothetical protein [Acidimicrobiia bacterium]